MATRKQFLMSTSERRARHFSTSFRIKKVQEIEQGKARVSDICKQYDVTSTSVYRWIDKFGSMKKSKSERVIVETESDSVQLLALKQKVAELERIIGQKQVQIDFKDKMIELAEEMYSIDIKKKFSTKHSDTTGTDEKS